MWLVLVCIALLFWLRSSKAFCRVVSSLLGGVKVELMHYV